MQSGKPRIVRYLTKFCLHRPRVSLACLSSVDPMMEKGSEVVRIGEWSLAILVDRTRDRSPFTVTVRPFAPSGGLVGGLGVAVGVDRE